MVEEFPPREMMLNDRSGIYYLQQTEKSFREASKNIKFATSDIDAVLSHELLNSPIFGVYVKNNLMAFSDDILFKCLICDAKNYSCFSAVGYAYDHIYVCHRRDEREISRVYPLSWKAMKWYWICIGFSKNEGYKYHIAEGVRQNDWNTDIYGDMSIRMLSDSDNFCIFCGDNYCTMPAKEVILAHLTQCKSLPLRIRELVYECAGAVIN